MVTISRKTFCGLCTAKCRTRCGRCHSERKECVSRCGSGECEAQRRTCPACLKLGYSASQWDPRRRPCVNCASSCARRLVELKSDIESQLKRLASQRLNPAVLERTVADMRAEASREQERL